MGNDIEKLEQQIKAYLEQEPMEYFEGCKLYAAHPGRRNNVVIVLEQRHDKDFMWKKLVYELEKLVGLPESQREAKPNIKKATVPVHENIALKVDIPRDYNYKIPFENLPEELKTIVIEKGQLYNTMDQSKKELAAIGDVNDVQSVAKRKVIMSTMKAASERIKKIHSILMHFEETEQYNPEEVDRLKEKAVGGHAGNKEGVDRMPKTSDELLEEEFKYQSMDYFQRKDLLKRLRSSTPKQEKRAEEAKTEDTRQKNQAKAEMGRKMIAILEEWFKTNEEPK